MTALTAVIAAYAVVLLVGPAVLLAAVVRQPYSGRHQ
jgi:hypothetical protein